MFNKLLLNKKNNLFYIQSILFILLPPLLITGPFLSDLAVSIIAIFFLITLFKKKELNFLNNNLFKVFLIFWIYLILNSLLQNQNLDSLRISFFHIRFGLFSFAIFYILKNEPKLLKYFFYSLLISMTALFIDGLIQFFFEKNLLGFELASGPRVSSFFGDELILGSYVARLLPILTGIFILIYMQSIKKNLIIFFSIFYLFLEALIFISGERTAFFYFILSSIFIFSLVSNFKRIGIFIAALSIIFVILALNLNPSLKDRMYKLTLTELDIQFPKIFLDFVMTKDDLNKDEINLTFGGLEEQLEIYNNLTLETVQRSYDLGLITESQKLILEKKLKEKRKIIIFSEHHTEHFTSALKMVKDNLFFGVGVKNFRTKCKEPKYRVSDTSCSTHPHNSYVQLLTETGLFGFIYFFSFFCFFLFYVYKHISLGFQKKVFLSNFEICMLAAILITLWPLAPTGNIFNNWLNIIFHIPVGFFLWSRKKGIKIINL